MNIYAKRDQLYLGSRRILLTPIFLLGFLLRGKTGVLTDENQTVSFTVLCWGCEIRSFIHRFQKIYDPHFINNILGIFLCSKI